MPPPGTYAYLAYGTSEPTFSSRRTEMGCLTVAILKMRSSDIGRVTEGCPECLTMVLRPPCLSGVHRPKSEGLATCLHWQGENDCRILAMC